MPRNNLKRYMSVFGKENIDENGNVIPGTDDANIGANDANQGGVNETPDVPVVDEEVPVIETEPVVIADVPVDVEVRTPDEVKIVEEVALLEDEEETANEDLDSVNEVEEVTGDVIEELQDNEEVLTDIDATKVSTECFNVIERSRLRLAKRYNGLGILTESFTSTVNDSVFSIEAYNGTTASLRRNKIERQLQMIRDERVSVEAALGDILVKGEAVIQSIISTILNSLDIVGHQAKSASDKVAEAKKENKPWVAGSFDSKSITLALLQLDADGKVKGKLKAKEVSELVTTALDTAITKVTEFSGTFTKAKIEAGEYVDMAEAKSKIGQTLKAVYSHGSVAGTLVNDDTLAVGKVTPEADVKDISVEVLSLDDAAGIAAKCIESANQIKAIRGKLKQICNDRIAIVKSIEAKSKQASDIKDDSKAKAVSAYKQSRVFFNTVKELLAVKNNLTKVLIGYVNLSTVKATQAQNAKKTETK